MMQVQIFNILTVLQFAEKKGFHYIKERLTGGGLDATVIFFFLLLQL
jgi:hypothetical protein